MNYSINIVLLLTFIVLNPNKEPISEWAQGGLIPACKEVQQTFSFEVCDYNQIKDWCHFTN